MDLDIANKVIDKYDEILTMTGSQDKLRDVLDRMSPMIDENIRASGKEVDVEKTREQLKYKLLCDVTMTIAQLLTLTLQGAQQTFGTMVRDKDMVRSAVDEYLKSNKG